MTPTETIQLTELITFIVCYFAIGGILSLIAGCVIHHSNDLEQD